MNFISSSCRMPFFNISAILDKFMDALFNTIEQSEFIIVNKAYPFDSYPNALVLRSAFTRMVGIKDCTKELRFII